MDIKEGAAPTPSVKCFVRVCNIANDLSPFRGVTVNNHACPVMKSLFSVPIGWESLASEPMIAPY